MKTSLNISQRMAEAGIRPRKSLGQNFLVNAGVYKKILAALDLRPVDTVLEIGPGLGTLTDFLADSGARIVAVEKDRVLVPYLRKRYAHAQRVEIVEGDILNTAPRNLKIARPYALVGNIPYYLTSHLFRVVFEEWPTPERIVVLVQKEVARRITARPPDMSLLAISVQYYARPEILMRVGRGSFHPAPRVDSALVRLMPLPDPDPDFSKKFFAVVRAGFSGKRRQLANTLTSLEAKEVVAARLRELGIDPRRRAETLTVEDWKRLTILLLPGSSSGNTRSS